MCSQQENSGPQPLLILRPCASQPTTEGSWLPWHELRPCVDNTSNWQLSEMPYQSSRVLSTFQSLQSIFCRLFFWKCDWQYWWSPHTSFSSKVGASVDRQRYLQVSCSLYTFVLGNHKCLQPANKYGLLHASNIRRQFRRATDNSHWHHASHSFYSSADLVLFLILTFKHCLMN